MISKNTVWMCVLSVVMAVYLAVALTLTAGMSRRDTLTGFKIAVCDTLSTRFITKADIAVETGIDADTLRLCPRRKFDLHALEARLRASDKIQDVNAAIMADGSIAIDVVPMVPVARVFESGKESYYINRSGKRISAEPRYHLDVPVLMGRFDSVHPASRLLPLLDHIASDSRLSALVSSVRQEKDGNIIIVPVIVGHVINFGDTSLVADKFDRLRTFYRKVAPVKGWDMYDTVAVKWRGQVVATRRHKKPVRVELPTTILEISGAYDIDDDETITDPAIAAEGIIPEE